MTTSRRMNIAVSIIPTVKLLLPSLGSSSGYSPDRGDVSEADRGVPVFGEKSWRGATSGSTPCLRSFNNPSGSLRSPPPLTQERLVDSALRLVFAVPMVIYRLPPAYSLTAGLFILPLQETVLRLDQCIRKPHRSIH